MLLINYLADILNQNKISQYDVNEIISIEQHFNSMEELLNRDISEIDHEKLSCIEMSLLVRYHEYMMEKYPSYQRTISELFKNIEV